MTVENIGDSPGDFFPANQYIVTRSGEELGASDEANFTADPDGIAQAINPGNSVEGRVIFDVAERFVDRIDVVRLHDSAFSGGVTVAVGE